MRPVMVGFMLVADLFVVVVLVMVRPRGWVPIAFGSLLVGLIWF